MKEPLWCGLVQRKRIANRKIVWDSKLVYTHAPDLGQARFRIIQGEPMGNRLIECARAVGFIAEDDHGDVCKADAT